MMMTAMMRLLSAAAALSTAAAARSMPAGPAAESDAELCYIETSFSDPGCQGSPLLKTGYKTGQVVQLSATSNQTFTCTTSETDSKAIVIESLTISGTTAPPARHKADGFCEDTATGSKMRECGEPCANADKVLPDPCHLVEVSCNAELATALGDLSALVASGQCDKKATDGVAAYKTCNEKHKCQGKKAILDMCGATSGAEVATASGALAAVVATGALAFHSV